MSYIRPPGRPLALVAVLLCLGQAAQVCFGQVAQAGSGTPETVVAIGFDDGDATHVAAARMLQKRGVRGTFYINSATLGNEGKLTRDQVKAIARAGHEIGGHTLNHSRLTELTSDLQREQICDDRRALLGMGYRATTFAYPFGAVDADAMRTAARCGYNAARTVGGLKHWNCPSICPSAEGVPPKNPFRVRTPGSVRDDTSLKQIKQYVLNAEKSGGGLVPLVIHRVCDDCGLYSVPPKVLDDFLVWLVAREKRGTTVRPLGEVIGGKVRPVPADR
ncbi:polysaccharide deacetylase family protein [Streptosporangium sp. NPDC000396]|uniref:polysaccharide deacetylase family protein n=1 Tax=Streptosporangium sp. NPDC000396 TaxID=3366185 RepID=UPI0036C638A9